MSRRLPALALAAAGLASFAWGILQGELHVALVLVVPVVYGSSVWGLLGVGLLVAAFLVAARGMGPQGTPVGWERRRREDPPGAGGAPVEDDRDGDGGWRGAGVVMLGPIPVAFGSDRSLLVVLMVLGLLLLVAGLVLTWTTG